MKTIILDFVFIVVICAPSLRLDLDRCRVDFVHLHLFKMAACAPLQGFKIQGSFAQAVCLGYHVAAF